MRIYIVPNLSKPNSDISLKRTLQILECNGIDTVTSDNGKIENDKIISSDILIAIGGDGTIIDVCKKASFFEKPVLGINSGRIGFLAGLEHENLEDLAKLGQNDFKIEEATMLQVYIKSSPEKIYYCLNDVVLTRQRHTKMIDVDLNYADNCLSYRGDGLIVATPVGSTAYSMSAGGPIVDRSVKGIVVTPICPFSYFSSSIIIDENNILELSVKDVEEDGVSVIVDGEFVDEFSCNDVLCVKKSSYKTRFISFENNSFYRKLIEKIK